MTTGIFSRLTCCLLRDKKQKNKSLAINKLLRLWSPFDSRLVLKGTRVPDKNEKGCTVVTDPEERLDALRTHWAPTFDIKHLDIDKAKITLDMHG